jgi:hypothetical protein
MKRLHHQPKTEKTMKPNSRKKTNDLRHQLLIITPFIPIGVELIRLIEELLKPFTH